MPSQSSSQRRLFGWVRAVQKGEAKDAPEKIKEVARHISPESADHFAKTKEKGLPEHKSAEFFINAYLDVFMQKYAFEITPAEIEMIEKAFKGVAGEASEDLGFKQQAMEDAEHEAMEYLHPQGNINSFDKSWEKATQGQKVPTIQVPKVPTPSAALPPILPTPPTPPVGAAAPLITKAAPAA